MYEHIKNIKELYEDGAYVQIPNNIFCKLSSAIKNKNGSINIQQTSFAYAYIVVISILYKYAHFVDINNKTYIQNADIKEFLGYSKTTKSIDSIIKSGGILDNIGLTIDTKSYPVSFIVTREEINQIPMREFITINDVIKDSVHYNLIKDVVKNRNYKIKEPTFLFEHNGVNGTLYDYSNTHTVTLDELLKFVESENLNNIDFYLYCFLKSKCKGFKNNSNSISLNTISSQLGIGFDAFYSHLEKLKKMKYVDALHKGWKSSMSKDKLESNAYTFYGISDN